MKKPLPACLSCKLLDLFYHFHRLLSEIQSQRIILTTISLLIIIILQLEHTRSRSMVLKAKFLSKEAQWMFRNGHERNFMMVSSCLLTQIKTTTTRGMEQFGKMKSIMMNNHQFRPLMTSLVSREVSKPTITEQQIQSAFEKKRLKHEQKQQEYETKMKNRSKERTREFVKWVGLFSILFFSITLYHINWLVGFYLQ